MGERKRAPYARTLERLAMNAGTNAHLREFSLNVQNLTELFDYTLRQHEAQSWDQVSVRGNSRSVHFVIMVSSGQELRFQRDDRVYVLDVAFDAFGMPNEQALALFVEKFSSWEILDTMELHDDRLRIVLVGKIGTEA